MLWGAPGGPRFADAGRLVLAEAEVVIVGGGPVGLATALELGRRGREVLVVDRAHPPIDKACGEGLMPDGVEVLDQLGIDLASTDSQPLRGIRYLDGDLVAEGRFPGLPGRGVRRLVLHEAMVEKAAAAGIRCLWDVPVRGLGADRVETDSGDLRAEWIVGADGLHSRIRRWAGLVGPPPRFLRCGIRRHYAAVPWSDRVEVYWASQCEAYVTPISEQQVGVAILWSGGAADFDSLLERFPSLKRRVSGAQVTSRDKGAAQLEQHCRTVQTGKVALVGDAAGYRDAITGEGLSMGFHQARALAVAIDSGRLHEYAKTVRGLSSLPNFLIRVLLEAERRPWLRRRLIRTLAREEGLFDRLLAIHARQALPGSVGLQGLWQLARGLLR